MSTVVTATQIERNQVYQTAPLRKARVEVQQLYEQLMSSPQQDHLTTTLKKVVTHFHEKLTGLERAHAELWRDRLIVFLQRALCDLSDPWLGSDGYPYGGKALTLYYVQCEEEKLECSPTTGEEGFFLEPHQAAHLSIEWLKKRGIDIENPEVNAAYDALSKKGWALPLPTRDNRWLRHTYWRQIQQVKQLEEMTSFAESLAQADSMVPQFEREVDRVIQEAEASEKKIEQFAQTAKLEHARFMESSAKLEADLAQERKACNELQLQCVELGAEIIMTRHEVEELKNAVQACEEALEELKEQRMQRQMLRVVGIIVNIGFAMATGIPLATALGVQIKRAVVSLGVSALVKEPTAASIVAGGINGMTEAPLSKASYVAAGVKGAALPVISGTAKALGVEPSQRGAINGVAATLLTHGKVQTSDMVANAGLGGIGGALSTVTDINVDLSVSQRKLNLNMQA